MGLTKIFESTQVTLNLEFLSLIPESIEKSSFFDELAGQMGLKFCEQVDNGCPVFLGLWDNVLQAEKKLEQLLLVWEEEKLSVHDANPLQSNTNLVLSSNGIREVDAIKNETQCTTLESCAIEQLNPPSTSSFALSTECDTSVSTKSPQLYFVSSDNNHQREPQLIYCKLNKNGTSKTTQKHNNAINEQTQELPTINKENDTCVREIYVDISMNPVKKLPGKKQSNNQRDSDAKSSANQHSLDKLCELLCIEEDETTDKRLSESEKNKSEDKLPFKFFCDQCSFKTKRENHLLKHAKLHEKIKDLFYCDQCDFKTIRESVLCRHKMLHSGVELVCMLCPYKTYTSNFLLKHMRVRHGPTNWKKVKCNHCDYVATTLRDLQKHNKLLHKSQDSPKFWKCSKCSYKSKLRAHLTRHENDVHGSLRQFLCQYCGKTFKRNDTLTQHKIIHGEVNKTFTCQTCGKVCTSSVLFREHLASHTTERPFLCDVCGSAFKTRGATQRHKRAMHPANNSLLSCTQCGCIFKTRPDLNKHRKIHRCKTEATVVPGVESGATVQENLMMNAPITIKVIYTNQLESNNEDVIIKQ